MSDDEDTTGSDPNRQTKEAATVPIIDVKVMEGVLSTEQKASIASGVTDLFAKVVGEPARGVTWVLIQDVVSGQWTMGGEIITTEGVRGLLRGASVTG
jgi:4-oxalocrotonate tautomerase